MFSYCNRNNRSSSNKNIYDYNVEKYKIERQPSFLCNGIYQQHVVNRGVPDNLIDINSQLRGQGSSYQHCMNDSREIQFESIRPMPAIPKNGSPCMASTSYRCERLPELNRSYPKYGHPDLSKK